MPDLRSRAARSLHVAGWILLAGIPAALFAPGCQGRECESDGFHDYGYGPGEGHLVDANTWETTPNFATWLPFGPYTVYVFHPVGLEGRDIQMVIPYISPDSDPNDPGKNMTVASGNSATINVSSDSRSIFVSNSTCAPVYIRLVVVADPLPPGSPSGNNDGGSDDSGVLPDADALDAGDGGD